MTDNQYMNLNENDMQQLKSMVKSHNKNPLIELETSIKNATADKFYKFIKYIINMTDDITTEKSLDISLLLTDGNTYRISIIDNQLIDKFISNFIKSEMYDVVNYLLQLKSSDSVRIIYKNKTDATYLTIPEYSIVIKTTIEEPITSKSSIPKSSDIKNILYRYKNRYSFGIDKNVRIDTTEVNQSSSLYNLLTRWVMYEIEIESINNKNTVDTYLSYLYKILCWYQSSDILMSKSNIQTVNEQYNMLLSINDNTKVSSRNVISLEAQHIVNYLPNRYAVSDKADGERYYMLILSSGVYLMTLNREIIQVDIKLNTTDYNNTILDGELIHTDIGRLYAAFDIVYSVNTDYSYNENYNLTYRLNVLANVIDKCFGTYVKYIDYASVNKDMSLDKINQHNKVQIKKFQDQVKSNLIANPNLCVSNKLVLVPYGIDNSEVFAYADMIFKLGVHTSTYPYTIDGIIYTPIGLPYMIKTNIETLDDQPLEYKWKPPTQNSIDLYIKIETDAMGADAIYYDDAVVNSDVAQYKICELYVGITRNRKEIPVPFKIDGVPQKANLYIIDGETRDREGNIIETNSVVEFIYDNTKPDVKQQYRWIALRTRYDKTESVRKFKRKYGNNATIAQRIWKTIINPVTENDISSLANPLVYNKEIDRIKKMVGSQSGPSYYPKISNVGFGMRDWHNFIKSNMITTYCKNKFNVLDVGCGRGGDIGKFARTDIKEYVGIDIDNNGLYNIEDSAYNRYNKMKKQISDIPDMYFINADAKTLFNVSSQLKVLPDMTELNKQLMEKHLSGNKKYDVVNAQFTLHYYMSDEISWKNFCTNLNDHLNFGGYLLITCFDGDLIYDKMKSKRNISVSYTDKSGIKKMFFDIAKVYDDEQAKTNPIGNAIDVYNSLISKKGVYNREYLVFSDYLTSSLRQECGLDLVETDSFHNLFNLYKYYFLNADISTDTNANISTRNKWTNLYNFYKTLHNDKVESIENDLTYATYQFSMLNRYFVFRKTKRITDEPTRLYGINQRLNMGKILGPYFYNFNAKVDIDRQSSNINNVYKSIYNHYKVKPNIYLIRHTIQTSIIDGVEFPRNKIELVKAKSANNNSSIMIYKSPSKQFYPIYKMDWQQNQLERVDNTLDQLNPKNMSSNKNYLFNSDKIINEIDWLIDLAQRAKIN